MSYLSSILGSINNPSAPRSSTASPSNQSTVARPPPPSISSLKRQADNTASGIRAEKFQREHAPQPKPEAKAARPLSGSYGGTARPAAIQTSGQSSSVRPAQPSPAKARPPQAATPAKVVTPATPGPPPSKGSYKDILARAAATQKAQANFGKVTHKPVEKLSRKERLKREEEAAAAARKIGRVAGTANGRSQGSGPSGGVAKSGNAGRVVGGPKSAASNSEKPRRQPIDLGYKGTMRAGAPSAPRPAAKQRTSYPSNSRPYGGSRYTYAESDDGSDVGSYDDNDDQDDDEDEGGGGFGELEEEEEQSSRAGRKEDAEALREENEHRREKEARRKRLAALAAKRK